MDWKQIVGTGAPILATMFGTPALGAAVSVLAKSVLGSSSGDVAKDETALSQVFAGGMTPELQTKVLEAESVMKVKLAELKVEEKKVDRDIEVAYLGDVGDARKNHHGDRSLTFMGAGVLIAWALLMGMTLGGLYYILIGGAKITDVGMVATVFTVMGSVVGYVSNAGQQVLSYFFGSSRGFDRNTTALRESVSNVGR